MSTYTDLHDRVKESLVVDYRSRVTTQRAKFLNHDNEYWGKFKGQIDAINVDLSSGQLAEMTSYNEVLIDPKLKTSEGTIIDLGGLADEIQALSNKVEETIPAEIDSLHEEDVLIRETINDLSDQVSADLQYLSSKISASSGGYDELEQRLCAEIKDREAADIAISTDFNDQMALEKAIRAASDESLKNDIAVEAFDREAADVDLSNDLVEKIESDIEREKHYSRTVVNSKLYPIPADDYSVNILDGFESPVARVVDSTSENIDIAHVTEFDKINRTVTIRPYGRIASELSSALTSDLTLTGYAPVIRDVFSFQIEDNGEVWDEQLKLSSLNLMVNPSDRTWRLLNADGFKYGIIDGVVTENDDIKSGTFGDMTAPFEWANGLKFDGPSAIVHQENDTKITFLGGHDFEMVSGLVLFETLIPEGDIVGVSARVYKDSVISSESGLSSFALWLNGNSFAIDSGNQFSSYIGDFQYAKFDPETSVISAEREIRMYAYDFENAGGMFDGCLSIADPNARLEDESLTSDMSVRIGYDDPERGLNLSTVVLISKNGDSWNGEIEDRGWLHNVTFDPVYKTVIWHAKTVETVPEVVVDAAFAVVSEDPIVEILDELMWSSPVRFDFIESEPAPADAVTAYRNAKVHSHVLKFDQRNVGIRFEMPPRTSDVMREALFVIRPSKNAQGDVQVDFVEADGSRIWSPDEERSPYFTIPRGVYSVLRVQEVNYVPGKYGRGESVFQLEDLNDQADESKIRELMRRVCQLESDVSDISADLGNEIERSILSDELLLKQSYDLSAGLSVEQRNRWWNDRNLSVAISDLSGEFKISADALVARDSDLALSCEDLYISVTAVSSKLNTEIERSTLSDQNLILAYDGISLCCGNLSSWSYDLSSGLTTEIERSTLSDESLIEDISVLSSKHLALSGRYDSTFVSIDKSADPGQHISSDNLVITDVNPDGGDVPAHDRYYMTFEYGTAVLKKIK